MAFFLGFDLSLGIRRRIRREMKKMNVENEVRDPLRHGRIGIVLLVDKWYVININPPQHL